MTLEYFRNHCLALPGVTEDTPFDPTTLCFRVGGNDFVIVGDNLYPALLVSLDTSSFDMPLVLSFYYEVAVKCHKRFFLIR